MSMMKLVSKKRRMSRRRQYAGVVMLPRDTERIDLCPVGKLRKLSFGGQGVSDYECYEENGNRINIK